MPVDNARAARRALALGEAVSAHEQPDRATMHAQVVGDPLDRNALLVQPSNLIVALESPLPLVGLSG